MARYKHGSHTVCDCKYRLVWITRYRHVVLGGDVRERCRDLLRETARLAEYIKNQVPPEPDDDYHVT